MPDSPFITYKHSIDKTEGYSFEITRLLSGTLELSALYSFKFLIRLTKEKTDSKQKNCREIMKSLLGSRIQVSISAGGTTLQTIHGLIMSIESTTQYERGNNAGWYTWTVRPELAKACYSLNRQVFPATYVTTSPKSLGARLSTAANILPFLIQYFDQQWNTKLIFSEKAQLKVPFSIQYRQNDESDYNFLTRLLSSWGLGYAWQFGSQQEELCIFDATDEEMDRLAPAFSQHEEKSDHESNTDAPQATSGTDVPHIIEPASLSASLWKMNYGVQDLAADVAPAIENYNKTSSVIAPPRISLHNETWDQLSDASIQQDLSAIHLSANDNAYSCHGVYTVRSADDVAQAMHLHLGAKVDWKDGDSLQCATGQPFYITRMQFDAANLTWRVIVDGHTPSEQTGLGVLPRPVRINNRPDLSEDELITCDAWPAPRMRLFLAIVEDGSTYCGPEGVDGKTSTLTARNLCKVREIAKHTITAEPTLALENTLWVELGSPFADNDSGLLTRPRKGNVLVCIDRGDLSIPLAISSLFRDNNAAPFAELHTLNRQTRGNAATNVTDYSAVTLRNRTHVPARDFLLEKPELLQTELDLNVRDGSTGSDSSTATTRYDVQATRPISVSDLASNRLPFNQIQMVSLDNGVQPVEQKGAISKTYLSSAVVETIAGMALDMDNSSYIMAGAAKDALNTLNAPITRPHFEGISMYTNSDLLLQSADHQIINAGGEIVVTAAQAITLRVGRSSIRISEDGVEISCPAGLVQNPGAYAPYHSGKTGQIVKCSSNMGMALGGSIQVGTSGVTVKGPYVTNFATNMFKASTFLGSSFTVSDYAAKLYAPSTTIVGGAAMVDTVHNLVTGGAIKSLTLDTSLSETNVSAAYSGPLVDGRKLANPELANYAGTFASVLAGGIDLAVTLKGLLKNGAQNYKNLVSVTGSLLKLSPETLEEYAVSMKRYAASLSDSVAPLAGFKAIQTRAGLGDLLTGMMQAYSSSLKTINTLTAKLNSAIGSKMSSTGEWKNHQDLFTLIQGIICPEATIEKEYSKAKDNGLDAELHKAKKDSATGKLGAEAHTILATVGLCHIAYLIECACKLMIGESRQEIGGTTEETLYRKTTALREHNDQGAAERNVLEEDTYAVKYKQSAITIGRNTVSQNVKTVDCAQNSVELTATSVKMGNNAEVQQNLATTLSANVASEIKAGMSIRN